MAVLSVSRCNHRENPVEHATAGVVFMPSLSSIRSSALPRKASAFRTSRVFVLQYPPSAAIGSIVSRISAVLRLVPALGA